MPRNEICYPSGVPRWVTYLAHMWYRRRCRRDGHAEAFMEGRSDMCGQCGLYNRSWRP